MNIGVLSRDDVEIVRRWRNDERGMLRTPHYITEEMQQAFYNSVVNNPDSRHRYYAMTEPGATLVGMGGLTNIEWENGRAEILLIITPHLRGKGLGMQAVELLLDEGFANMALRTIWGVVYECGNVGFWERCIEEYGGQYVDIPWPLKRWDGIDYGGMMFAFSEGVHGSC